MSVMMIILIFVATTSGKVIRDHTADQHTYKVLQSDCKRDSCDPVKPLLLKHWIANCFEPVPEGFHYECITIETYGVAEIFLPNNLVCEAGIGIKYTYVESEDAVRLTHIPCPPGTYQDRLSNCVDSCYLKHPVTKGHVIIREPQNTTSMGDGYCDWKNGFFNLDGVNTFSLGQQKDCVHRSEHSNQCPDNEMDILPGGRCDKKCNVGYSRDPYDDFKCSLKDPVPPYGSGSTVGGQHTTIPVPTRPTTDPVEMDKRGSSQEMNVVIPVVCGVGVVFIFVILTLVFLLCKKGRNMHYQLAPSNNVSSTSSVNTSEEISAPASSASSVNTSEKIPAPAIQKKTKFTRKGCNKININAEHVIINQNYEGNKPVDDQKGLVETFESHPPENLKETTIRSSDSS